MLTTASAAIEGPAAAATSGASGIASFRMPNAPIFESAPAINAVTEGGASQYASGSHEWNGTIGHLTAQASMIATNTKSCMFQPRWRRPTTASSNDQRP